MARRKSIFSIALIFGGVVLFSAISSKAQPIEDREPLRIKATVRVVGIKPSVKRPTRKNRTADSSLLVKTTVKRPKVVTDTTSDLTIETETDATVIMALQPSRKGIKPTEIKKTASSGKAVFENLKPGKYTISAALEDFVERETDVTIEPQKTAALSFPLEAIQYQLNIETNIPDGEVRYAPAALVEKKPDGSVRLKPEGNYCIVQIRDGKAKIEGLRKKYYTIDINPSPTALQYEPVKAAITPDLIVDEVDETEGLKYVAINLDTKISTDTFAPAWTNNEWELPSGWTLNKKLSSTGSNGIALPSNNLYRYYTDFEMVSVARSLDGKTVGFALRAVDPKNYYLIQIGGGKAAGRYLLTGYVVKNNVPTQLNSYDISAFNTVLDDKNSFRVIIKGKGNSFEVFMDDKRGTPQPLGTVTDGFGNFKKGAVGIAETNNSNFEVNFFTVCPSSCMK